MKANANGFYAINGNSVIDFKEGSKAKDVCEFLERIKEVNEYDPIVVLDNSKHIMQTSQLKRQNNWI